MKKGIPFIKTKTGFPLYMPSASSDKENGGKGYTRKKRKPAVLSTLSGVRRKKDSF